MKLLKLIKQDVGSKDCVAACLAMITDSSILEVKKQLPDGFRGCYEETLQMLTKLNVLYIAYASPIMVTGRLYLITVPSLNIPKRNHCILVDCRNEYLFVYDPSPNIKYSVEDVLNGMSYSEVVEILLD